jgi:DNA mismatch endonuclease (patch repair protein)
MRDRSKKALSWASSPNARATMLANRRRDTSPELRIRRILHAQGLRYRVDFAPAPTRRRRADIVFPRKQVAVFIDGCFWHGCPAHYVAPKTNQQFWSDKVSRNRSRDLETTTLLQSAGWTVLRFWEHELPEDVAAAIAAKVRTETR